MIFGLHGPNNHKIEISGDVANAGRQTNEQTNEHGIIGRQATQPMGQWKAEFCNRHNLRHKLEGDLSRERIVL